MNTPFPAPADPVLSVRPCRITPAEWDRLRDDFAPSMMVDTSLAALAENIDGCAWPVRGPSENPAAYLKLSHASALARLRVLGQPPSALDLLAEILRGTLAFDESFGEMVDVAAKAEADHKPLERNLERLGIPSDFPLRLGNFGAATLTFCQSAHITVIADFLAFSRDASQSVMIGGDFRALLNAISHIDEATIARLLPFRPKSTGLHFIESLAQLVRPLSDEQRQQLVLAPEKLPAELAARAAQLAAYFTPQIRDLRARLDAGAPLSRLVAPLEDTLVEPAVAALLRVHLQTPAPAVASESASAPPPRKRGFWQRLFGLGR